MDITLTITDDQDEMLRKMGVKEFELDIDSTSEDALMFIIDSNTSQRAHESLDAKWKPMGIVEKENRLKLSVPTGP